MSAEAPSIDVDFPEQIAETDILTSGDAERTQIGGLMEGVISTTAGRVAISGVDYAATCHVFRYTHRTDAGEIQRVKRLIACVDFGCTYDSETGTYIEVEGPVIGADIDCPNPDDVIQAEDVPEESRDAAFVVVSEKYRRRLEREQQSRDSSED